jgi:hypothetical protein
MTKAKFEVLSIVVHRLDGDKEPLLITGVVERPECYSYLATRAHGTELEYLEQELTKY